MRDRAEPLSSSDVPNETVNLDRLPIDDLARSAHHRAQDQEESSSGKWKR